MPVDTSRSNAHPALSPETRRAIADAAAGLHAGGVLAYPTEAVWGLGCDPDRAAALEALLRLKSRDPAKGLILVAADIEQFAPWLEGLSPTLYRRLGECWPGPVSWLVPDNGRAHPLVRGEHRSVALRVSAHPPVAALCRAFGAPLVSTSANVAGQAPCLSAAEVRRAFGASVEVLEGPLGGADRPSEIRDLLTDRVLRI